jgi:hypothetical protein
MQVKNTTGNLWWADRRSSVYIPKKICQATIILRWNSFIDFKWN